MKYDIVLAGVGGQGVLSIAAIIAESAVETGLEVKQSEIHGMSQRGGSVSAHLRLSDTVIAADTVSLGDADLIISAEPLEALRQLPLLSVQGWMVSATNAVSNFEGYPEPDGLIDQLESLPHRILLDAIAVAREAGSQRAANTVLLGAAGGLIPIRAAILRETLLLRFRSKGQRIVDANIAAFEAGSNAGSGLSQETGTLVNIGAADDR